MVGLVNVKIEMVIVAKAAAEGFSPGDIGTDRNVVFNSAYTSAIRRKLTNSSQIFEGPLLEPSRSAIYYYERFYLQKR